MNTLLYSARMALRDIYEVNVFTKGTDRVYLTVSQDLDWGVEDDPPAASETQAQDNRRDAEAAIVSAAERLLDMDMVLVGGDEALWTLMDSKAVEIIRKVG